MDFFLGIIASLVTQLIIFIFIRIFKLEKIKLSIAKKLLKEDYFPFDNQKKAVTDIYEKLKESCEIRILSIRGISYIGDEGDFSFIWEDKSKRIEIILSDIFNSSIKRRSGAVHINNKDYKKEIELVNEYILQMFYLCPNLTYYRHNQDLAFRLIILDKYMYLSFFNISIKASESKMYRFERDSQIYKAFLKYYKDIRRVSKKVKINDMASGENLNG